MSTVVATATDASVSASLEIIDVKVGDGAVAENGKALSVHYAGTFRDGKRFDASRDHAATPFRFLLGDGTVMPGWEKGLVGMRAGGMRRLVVPPALAYGSRGIAGIVPPNSTLIFEIELLKVE